MSVRALAVVVLLMLAGCASPSEPAATLGEPISEVPSADPGFALAMTDCLEVSGVSVYAIDGYRPIGPPAPWNVRDIWSEIGEPRIGSAGGVLPPVITNGAAGHWHSAIACSNAQHNGTDIGAIAWGWVGVGVEVPDFGDPDCTHYLAVVWSWPQQLTSLVASHGYATPVEAASATLGPATATMLLDDVSHGRYEGAAPVVSGGEASSCRTFWLLLPSAGMHNHHGQEGPFTPVAFVLQGSHMVRLVSPETIGPFAHTETDHHAPLPGLGGNAAMVVDGWGELTLTAGEPPASTFNETWVH